MPSTRYTCVTLPWPALIRNLSRTVNFDGVRLRLWSAATNGHIVHPPDDIWVWRMTVEWYWQGKTEEIGEKPVPVPHCPPQIPRGLTGERIRASAVRGQRLTSWVMSRSPRAVKFHFAQGKLCHVFRCEFQAEGISSRSTRTWTLGCYLISPFLCVFLSVCLNLSLQVKAVSVCWSVKNYYRSTMGNIVSMVSPPPMSDVT
jgi:hypothetical protein